jgi:hypothetical protein
VKKRNKVVIVEDVVITRVGEMEYLESEVVEGGSSSKVVRVIRGEELLKRKGNSLLSLPLTISHSDNAPVVGEVITSRYDYNKKAIVGDIMLFNESYKGKEISMGYLASVEKIDEDLYKLVDFVPEHVAIVNSGRCGIICKL